MSEKLKAYWETARGKLKTVPKKVYILIAVGLVAIAAFAVIAIITRPYTVLFTGLNGEDASAIIAYLEQEARTDYRLENGDTILVPKSQENSLKMKLLMAGYPKNSGYSYSSYYEHVSALSTESERETAFLMSVEERMGAVIGCMDGVKEAVVFIAPGEDRTYILDSENLVGASASIMITMQNGQKLSKQQVSAIRNFVAHAVQGLEIDSVDIEDSMGNHYGAADGSGELEDASALKLQLEEENSNKIRTIIMQVLTPVFGEENVRVGVNCTVNIDRVLTDSTTYELPPWAADGSTGGKGVIGSRVYEDIIVRGGEAAAGGVVGTQSNADLSQYIEEGVRPDGTEKEISTSGQVDYDNNMEHRSVEQIAGYLTDCMVSVSINTTAAGTVNAENLRTHVARAAGISDEQAAAKISILPMPFYEPGGPPTITPNSPIPVWAVYAAAGGLLLFLLLLFVIFMIRRGIRKRRQKREGLQTQDERLASEGVPAPEPIAHVMDMNSEASMQLRKDIRGFADESPEVASQMLKSWLRGGDSDG